MKTNLNINKVLLSQDSLITPFVKNAQNNPHNPAIFINDKFYNYYQLYEIAVKLATYIQASSKSQCVIFCKRTFTAYIGIIAALLARKTYVPLNPTSPPEKNLNIIKKLPRRCDHYR